MRDRTLAVWCPHTARDQLQANAVFVCREDLDWFARMLRRLFGNGVRELFLNAAASSGVADFGFFGRGFWIDQPIAFSASQPRWVLLLLREKALQGDARVLDRLLDLARLFNNDASESGSAPALAFDDRAILDAYTAEIAATAKAQTTASPGDQEGPGSALDEDPLA